MDLGELDKNCKVENSGGEPIELKDEGHEVISKKDELKELLEKIEEYKKIVAEKDIIIEDLRARLNLYETTFEDVPKLPNLDHLTKKRVSPRKPKMTTLSEGMDGKNMEQDNGMVKNSENQKSKEDIAKKATQMGFSLLGGVGAESMMSQLKARRESIEKNSSNITVEEKIRSKSNQNIHKLDVGETSPSTGTSNEQKSFFKLKPSGVVKENVNNQGVQAQKIPENNVEPKEPNKVSNIVITPKDQQPTTGSTPSSPNKQNLSPTQASTKIFNKVDVNRQEPGNKSFGQKETSSVVKPLNSSNDKINPEKEKVELNNFKVTSNVSVVKDTEKKQDIATSKTSTAIDNSKKNVPKIDPSAKPKVVTSYLKK